MNALARVTGAATLRAASWALTFRPRISLGPSEGQQLVRVLGFEWFSCVRFGALA